MTVKLLLIVLLSLSVAYACHVSCTCGANSNVCVSCPIPDTAMDSYSRSCPCNPGYYRSSLYPYSCAKNVFLDNTGNDISIPADACAIQYSVQLINAIINGTADTTVVADATFFVFYTKLDLSPLSITAACQASLSQSLKYKIGGVFVSINPSELATDANGNFIVTIPLIKLYDYSATTVFGVSQITQALEFQLTLSVGPSNLRVHNFLVTIYTNRDEVALFTEDISTLVTEGCVPGQECIVVADLDIKGTLCDTDACPAPRANNQYIEGDILIAKIEFTDPSYTKHLDFISAYMKDTSGVVINVTALITTVVSNYQIIIHLPLIYTSIGLILQVNLQISSVRLRSLSSSDNRSSSVQIKAVVQQATTTSSSSPMIYALATAATALALFL